MEQDNAASSSHRQDVDICVVGGGPAGLVVASTLARRGRDVMLLESGGRFPDPLIQQLNEGDSIGDAYAGLTVTRYRQLGGTPSRWFLLTKHDAGGKFVPLDPIDLEPRWEEARDGWPISYATLAGYYRKAEDLCLIGSTQDAPALPSRVGALAAPLVPRRYQHGTTRALLQPLIASIDAAPGCRVLTHATVIGITNGSSGAELRVAREGRTMRVHARCVVLACGAIENARLLLLASLADGAIDRSGWLGRGFMEHPRDRSITIALKDRERYHALSFYDQQSDRDGHLSAGRMALDSDFLRTHDQLNASVTLLATIEPERVRLRESLRRFRVPPPRRWFPADGHGWSQHPSPHSVYRGFTALLNLEQPPHRDNAVTLGTRCDMFGNPLPALHLRWHDDDHRRLLALRQTVAAALRNSGFDHVSIDEAARPDPNAHHHAGTTRMHDDPACGVVDANCRVHGAPSLYVAGASVFPTSGFANPTLTIVAMSLRLADHLSQ